jgi:uncharacterized protein YndB with AHSA1/START domain
MTTSTPTTSVSTAIEVDVPVERAFQVFTAGIGTWWDEDKHILQVPLAEMIFEPRVGGSIIDRGVDGSECRWARVLSYDPPRLVRFSWDINTRWQIETDPAKSSEIEITFTPTGPGRTHVVLTHRHLDRHGEGWESMRDAVSSGWSLTRFAQVAERPAVGGQAIGQALPAVSDQDMLARLGTAKPYTAMVLRTTSTFVRPDVDPIVWEHGRRNMALVDAGLLSIVLPVTDDSGLAGFGVFALAVEDVTAVMDADPGVQAGIFSYDVHPVRGFPGSALA